MKLQFNIYLTPPLLDAIEAERKRLNRQMPLQFLLIAASLFCIAGIFLDLWDRYPEQHTLLEFLGTALILAVGWSVWKFFNISSDLSKIIDAHSSTAKAIHACATNDTVKTYCASVMAQKRNMTMGETNLMIAEFRTDEEKRELGRSFEKHGIWSDLPYAAARVHR